MLPRGYPPPLRLGRGYWVAADPRPPPVTAALKELFLRGTKRPQLVGQPRVAAVVTGGGGHFLSWALSEPGASSCLLEALVPYDKNSCLSFLGRHRRAEALERGGGVGFCSEDMAALLAGSARDRALELTPLLVQWPDVVGVACTATIVSHYKRRGGYRCHAAAVRACGSTTTYTHALTKGARERPAEDAVCALLITRALAEATNLTSAAGLKSFGVQLEPCEGKNAVGEIAEGVEAVPVPRAAGSEASRSSDCTSATWAVRVPLPGPMPREFTSVEAPAAVLPTGSLLVAARGMPIERAIERAAAALRATGREGDGKSGPWAQTQAPVFFDVLPTNEIEVKFGATGLLAAAAESGVKAPALLGNWALLHRERFTQPSACESQQKQAEEGGSAGASQAELDSVAEMERQMIEASAERASFLTLLEAYPTATFVCSADALMLNKASWAPAPWRQQVQPALATAVARGATFVITDDNGMCSSDSTMMQMLSPTIYAALTWCVSELRVTTVSDGSPSTHDEASGLPIAGLYSGGWDAEASCPEGRGRMNWENGISYEGGWQAGKYHGYGEKLYSKGGGYQGSWVNGMRHGDGISLFDGKFGFDRWIGPFVSDKPHGVGKMTRWREASDEGAESPTQAQKFEFEHGNPLGFVNSEEYRSRG